MSINIENLGFSYAEKTVLKGISFNIEKGDFLSILGLNGSGKSTLVYCLNGIIPHSIKGHMTGKVTSFGLDTKKADVTEISKKIGMVFQDPEWQIFNLSVRDEIEFGLKNMKMDRIEERIKKALETVGLKGRENDIPHKLSQGEKQKLTIASVIAMEPEAIILDEPSSQLDYRSTINLYNMLKMLNEEGKTIIIIEHDTEMTARYANKSVILSEGKIELSGKVKDVFSDRERIASLGLKYPEGFL